MKTSFQTLTALSAIVGLFIAFVIVCLAPPDKHNTEVENTTLPVAIVDRDNMSNNIQNRDSNPTNPTENQNTTVVSQSTPIIVQSTVAQNTIDKKDKQNTNSVVQENITLPTLPEPPAPIVETPAPIEVPPISKEKPVENTAPAVATIPAEPVLPIEPVVSEPVVAEPVVAEPISATGTDSTNAVAEIPLAEPGAPPSETALPDIPVETEIPVETVADVNSVSDSNSVDESLPTLPTPETPEIPVVDTALPPIDEAELPSLPEDTQISENSSNDTGNVSASSTNPLLAPESAPNVSLPLPELITPEASVAEQETPQEPIKTKDGMSQPDFSASEAGLPSDVNPNVYEPMAPLPPGLFKNVDANDNVSDVDFKLDERSFIPRYVLQQRSQRAVGKQGGIEQEIDFPQVAGETKTATVNTAIGTNVQDVINSDTTILLEDETAEINSDVALQKTEDVQQNTESKKKYSFAPGDKMEIRKAFSVIASQTKLVVLLSPNVEGTVNQKAESDNPAEFLEQVLKGTEYTVKYSDELIYIGTQKDVNGIGLNFNKISTKEFTVKKSEFQILEWLIVTELSEQGQIVSTKEDTVNYSMTIRDFGANLYEMERLVQMYHALNLSTNMKATSVEYFPTDGQPFAWNKLSNDNSVQFIPIDGITENRAVTIRGEFKNLMTQLQSMNNVATISGQTIELSENPNPDVIHMSIKVSEVKDFPADWNSLPQNVDYQTYREGESIKLKLTLPTADPAKPEGLLFTMSPQEALAVVIPITVTPAEEKSFLKRRKKNSPIQKYIVTIFTPESNGSIVSNDVYSSSGMKFWATCFRAISQASAQGLTQDQKTFYAQFAQQLEKKSGTQNVVVDINITPEQVTEPVTSTTEELVFPNIEEPPAVPPLK